MTYVLQNHRRLFVTVGGCQFKVCRLTYAPKTTKGARAPLSFDHVWLLAYTTDFVVFAKSSDYGNLGFLYFGTSLPDGLPPAC